LDVNIVADLPPEHVSPLVEMLRQDFYIDQGTGLTGGSRRCAKVGDRTGCDWPAAKSLRRKQI